MIKGKAWGGFSREDGSYRVANVPAGEYAVAASMLGYESAEVPGVKVTAGGTVVVDFTLRPRPVGTLQELCAASRMAPTPLRGMSSQAGRFAAS